MEEFYEGHVEQVMAWLEENVQVIPEPETVTLSEFSINWEDFSGDFSLSFDAVMYSRKIRYGLEASGKAIFYMPMFFSPLGAPASYRAIEITEKTRQAILRGLQETFPRVKGAGLDRDTGKEIMSYTPPAERIDPRVLELAKIKVTKDYSIAVTVKNV